MFRGMEWSIAREFLRPVLSYDDLDYEAYDCWLCASPITKPLSIDGDPLPSRGLPKAHLFSSRHQNSFY